MHWLDLVLYGTPDAAALEHIRRGLNTWLNSATQGRRDANGEIKRAQPMGLARCLRLQDSPERARMALRNAYLIQAADLLPVESRHPWQRATALHFEAQKFAHHQWLCWFDLREPPSYASEVNALLWKAMRAGGGKLPTTARQYDTILKS